MGPTLGTATEWKPRPIAMLATLGGTLALLSGLAVLVLPLLLPELSRPRDAAWGALVLLLGLVLVNSAERLTGAPMLGVLCGGLLIGRLSVEVGQGRWRQLSEEEQLRLRSTERWQTALAQVSASATQLGGLVAGVGAALGKGLRGGRQDKSSGKRWVRPESPIPEPGQQEPAAVVTSFAELDALIEAAPAATDSPGAASPENAGPPGEVLGHGEGTPQEPPAHGEAG